ncbi:hypothetical protein A3K73_07465 [Candidatus Pacearchaeota archaeon RBG_13_36_9]|nr:MAG: hypothetical protein A3K73_07465 [Candidatus Pacearchaeota archaeon RBG_13_36_9]
MKKTVISMSIIFAVIIAGSFVLAVDAGCQNLYWIDNDNRECGQKEFCGAYMYYGLFTFENETVCQQYVLASSSGEINNSDCKSLYWIDDDNKSCGQNEFCGAYMYYGLQTFESKTQCENAAGINKTKTCPKNSGDENGKCMFNLSNGRKAEIKIMPETASQTAIGRLGELGFTVELKEVGKGTTVKPVYELTGNKQGKFLGIFKIMARVKAQVDAGTGDVKVIKPWWSFLASGV